MRGLFIKKAVEEWSETISRIGARKLSLGINENTGDVLKVFLP